MSALRYIGIDPGNSCGWALLSEDGHRIGSGRWNLVKAQSDGQGMRFVRFERLLRELIGPDTDLVVGYDLIQPYGSGLAKAMYYKVVGRLESCLDEMNLPYVGVPPSVYKRTATGKGNASKEATVAAAKSRWPELAGEDLVHDEADSLWIAEAVRLGLV